MDLAREKAMALRLEWVSVKRPWASARALAEAPGSVGWASSVA